MKERVLTSIEGYEVTLSHLERLVYPQAGLIKADIIKYYLQVAPYMLPHLRERPLVLTRFPDGVDKKGFYQKNAPSYLPPWIRTYPVEPQKSYILADNSAALVWLANQGCIEIHPWLSRVASLKYPDYLVIDLDPSPSNTFAQVVKVALTMANVLRDIGLESFPKTSGGKGLHIYIPIIPRYSYQQVRNIALKIAGIIVSIMPDLATTQRMKAKRGSRIYIDCLQIGEGKTLCAPYSLRPTPQATVSAPLRWEEITDINPAMFTLVSLGSRIDKYGDLFQNALARQQDLNKAEQALTIIFKSICNPRAVVT